MPKKYIDIRDQLLQNSKWNGECLESTFKVCKDHNHRRPYFTHKQKLLSVTREWWKLHNGDIPENMFICHHCDNPKCFRIEHLFLGTPSENMKDMVSKGRDNTFGARKYSKQQLIEIKNLRENGKSFWQIAKIMGINESGISAYCLRHRIVNLVPVTRDKKYSEELIFIAIKLRKEGLLDREIMIKLNIPECTFYRRMPKK